MYSLNKTPFVLSSRAPRGVSKHKAAKQPFDTQFLATLGTATQGERS
jgi:hypothetical protein